MDQDRKENLAAEKQENKFFLQAVKVARNMMIEGTTLTTFKLSRSIIEALSGVAKGELDMIDEFIYMEPTPEKRKFRAKYFKTKRTTWSSRLRILENLNHDYERRLKIRRSLES